MRAEMTELRGTVEMLVSIIKSGHTIPAIKQGGHDDSHSPLSDTERAYRIDRQELQALLGVSERTFYRRLKDYGFSPVKENGDIRFILGEVADIISRHGLNWHRKALDSLLSKRQLKSRRVYV